MPLTGKDEFIVMFFPEILFTEVCTVEGKNPANRGSAVKAINAILRIAILLIVEVL
jgi:hypothetical protein